MSEEPASPAQVSLSLTGKMLQFNITIGALLAGLVAVLWICSSSDNPVLSYGGTVMALLGIPAVVGFVIHFYSKQKERPMDGQATALVVTGKDGQAVTLQNPPDKLLDAVEVRAIMRCVLGYDRNICPDGELTGNAAEPNYRLLTKEEQEAFRAEHETEIRGRIAAANELLAQEEDNSAVLAQMAQKPAGEVVNDS